MADVDENPFPDLEGAFDPAESPSGSGVLDSVGRFQEVIGESELRKNHWRIAFRKVQYGIYDGEPACLIVVDGKFHAEDRNRHRFTWARIGLSFSSGNGDQPVEIKQLVPERAYGITVPEIRNTSWTLRSKASISLPGIPATVDILDVSHKTKKQYKIDRVAGMQGSVRGFPVANQVVWTIEEANQEGIPWRIPSLVVLVCYTPGRNFKVSFSIDAKVGFSLNPARWPLFASTLKPVEFSEDKQLIRKGRRIGS